MRRMANKYCNLDGSKKIKDEYQKINIGFDKVEEDVNKIYDDINAIDERVDTIITTPVEDVSAEEIIDARGGRPVLGKRFEDIEVELATHKAETIHQGKHSTLEATSTNDATSYVNAPLKSAGGLAVAKRGYFGDIVISKGAYINSSILSIPGNSTKILKFSLALNTICAIINIGGFVSGGGGFVHIMLSVGGYGGVSTGYNVKELEKWSANANVIIGTIQKNNGNITIEIENKNTNALEIRVVILDHLTGLNPIGITLE